MRECTSSAKRKPLKKNILAYRDIGGFHQLADTTQTRRARDGRSALALFQICPLEAMLVDFQCPDLRFQRGSRNAEFGSGTRGPVYASTAFAQGSFNDGLLLFWRPIEEAGLDLRDCGRRPARKPTFIH